MMIKFKEWLLGENSFRTGRLLLYPPLSDQCGQTPPLYAAAKSADFITYYNIAYPNGIPMKSPGIVDPDRHQHMAKNLIQSKTTVMN